MTIKCKVLINLNSDVEKAEELERVLDKQVYPECMWDERIIDITDATGLSKNEQYEEDYPDSCSEATGNAVIFFGEYSMITNISFEQMKLWFQHKRDSMNMEYDEEQHQLFILF